MIERGAGGDAPHPTPLVRAFADLRRRAFGVLGPDAAGGFVADLTRFVRAALAARALCWTNDLISRRKELREGESHNLVRWIAALPAWSYANERYR